MRFTTLAPHYVLFIMATIATAAAVHAQTFTVLYSFKGGPNDGAGPYAGLVADAAGNLYGTTHSGGPAEAGTVFELDTSGKETVLYMFRGGKDGKYPYFGNLARDSAGNLYGTTLAGGTASLGTVYKVDTSGTETVLHSFRGNQEDGASPIAGLLPISQQIAVGTTESGGAFGSGCDGIGCGTVFALDAAGHEKVLYSFTGGLDGSEPWGGLVRDSQGNLYGTTLMGGAWGLGTVFMVDRDGHETVLHDFIGGGDDGAFPNAGLVMDSDGNLYGTTIMGGPLSDGTIFKVDGGGEQGYHVLYTFTGSLNDGAFPYSALIIDSQGNSYGTTEGGGANNFGTVFELNGTTFKETVLHSFASASDGANPYSPLIRDSAGNLYGTTSTGGPSCCGTVFKLTP